MLAVVVKGYPRVMEHEQRESLRRQAEGLPVRVLRDAEDNLSYLSAGDLVVSMAGYNTLMEAIRLRKRILVVPRAGPSAEQRIRAQVFSHLGLVQAISPEQLSPSVLAQAILEDVDAGPVPPTSRIRMNGLTTVVREMRRLLQPEPAESLVE